MLIIYGQQKKTNKLQSKVLPQDAIFELDYEFSENDGWFICAASHEEKDIYHWKLVFETLSYYYGHLLYKFYPLRIPAFLTILLPNIYSCLFLIPWYCTLYYKYRWSVLFFAIGIYYPFFYHCFTMAWESYNPRNVARKSHHFYTYRHLLSLVFNLFFILSCTLIPIVVNDTEYVVSPLFCAPQCMFFIGCTILCAIKEHGGLDKKKFWWAVVSVLLLPTLFFLFPPALIISMILNDISPTLSGLYISLIFLLLEFGSITGWEFLYFKMIYKSYPSEKNKMDCIERGTGGMSGDQKKAMIRIIILVRTWCETARLCTLSCNLILGMWNEKRGFGGEENHMTYLSSAVFSFFLSTTARSGHMGLLYQKILRFILPKHYKSLEYYIKPSLWTWVHRDASFYFGYPRFLAVGSLFCARGLVLQSGFHINRTDFSFCFTEGVLYSFLINFAFEIFEDHVVYHLSRHTRENIKEQNTRKSIRLSVGSIALKKFRRMKTGSSDSFDIPSHVEDPFNPECTLIQKKNTEWSPNFRCIIKEYNFNECMVQVATNVILVLFLFILFIGKDGFLGRGRVRSPNNYLLDNTIELLIWKVV